MLHEINYRTGTDSGYTNPASIDPIADGEPANQTNLRRPTENNRNRTQVLRDVVRQHVMLHDYDRAQGMYGGGTITFNGASVTYDGKFTITGHLYVGPLNTPGDESSFPYVGSTKASLSVPSSGAADEIIFTSVQKQYEGSSFPDADANHLSVEIVHTGSLSVQMEEAPDEHHLYITINSGTTTCTDVISAVTGLAGPITAVAGPNNTTPGSTSAPLWGPTEWLSDYSNRFLRGGAPGVIHKIPTTALATFFGTAANVLKKGDTLAIWYDSIVEEGGGTGGRLQSTPENTNIELTAGSLFNTRVAPEKIPGCIPVCKCIDEDKLLFANGKQIIRGFPATFDYDSQQLYYGEDSLLKAQTWDRMDSGTVHNPPLTVRQGLDNADGHINEILNEIEAGRNSSIFGSKANIDTRMEAVDTHSRTTVSVTDGTATTGGMYNGAGALEAAVAALETAGIGGRILVRKGAYTWTTARTLTHPIQIIAVEDAVTITLSQASGYALTLGSAAAYVSNFSLVQGLTVNGLGKSFLNITGNTVVVEGCNLNVGVGIRVDGERIQIRSCRIFTDTAECILVRDTAAAVKISSCQFETDVITVPAVRFYGGGGLEPANVMEDCRIVCTADTTAGGPVSAIWVDNGMQHVKLKDISITCYPSNDTTTPVVHLANGVATIENMNIWVGNQSTQIRRPLFKAYTIEGVEVRNLHVDLNTNVLRYDTASKNPVILLRKASVDGLWLTRFKIPTTSTSGWSLDYAHPVIRVASGAAVAEPAQLKRLRVDQIVWANNSDDDGEFTIVGAEGGTGLSDQGYAIDGGAFHLEGFFIDLDGVGPTSPSGGEIRFAIANIPPRSTIRTGEIRIGRVFAAIQVVGCGDVGKGGCLIDNVIIDNDGDTSSWCWAGINVDRAATAGVRSAEIKIVNCTMTLRGSATTRFIQFNGFTSNETHRCVCCNNVLVEIYTSSTMDGIHIQYVDGLTVIGNVIELQGGGTHVNDGGGNAGIVPAIASSGTMNSEL
jgi:hypothetical protein